MMRPAHRTRPRAIVDAVRTIEATWLGYQAAPLPLRLERAAWHPDSPEVWCPRCGRDVGPHEVIRDESHDETILSRPTCSNCRSKRVSWDGLVRLGRFEGELRDVIHDIKFSRWHTLGRHLGHMLGPPLVERLSAEAIDPRRTVIVPVPTSFVRRMTRGVDHAMAIATGMSERTGIEVCRLLMREHRRSQVGLSQTQRLRNVKGSMKAIRQPLRHCRALVVADDVLTTGATSTEAVVTLREMSRVMGLQVPIFVAVAAVAGSG